MRENKQKILCLKSILKKNYTLKTQTHSAVSWWFFSEVTLKADLHKYKNEFKVESRVLSGKKKKEETTEDKGIFRTLKFSKHPWSLYLKVAEDSW